MEVVFQTRGEKDIFPSRGCHSPSYIFSKISSSCFNGWGQKRGHGLVEGPHVHMFNHQQEEIQYTPTFRWASFDQSTFNQGQTCFLNLLLKTASSAVNTSLSGLDYHTLFSSFCRLYLANKNVLHLLHVLSHEINLCNYLQSKD